jgi:pyroglutamyl-peptidase
MRYTFYIKQSSHTMNREILITSFTTWEPHQPSNAADDLLQRFIEEKGDRHHYLRHLPVDFTLAPRRVIETFEEIRPRVLVCCGMAEERTRLNVESRAVLDERSLETGIDLVRLTEDLAMTDISHDTGRFVCNTLYYRSLEHLNAQESEHHCLFIHVPVLTEENAKALTQDFVRIIARLAAL